MRIKTRIFFWIMLSAVAATLAAQVPAHPAAQSAPAADIPAAPKIPDNVRVVKDVPFCTGGGRTLLLDMYLPKNPLSRPTPAVLWIHGGAWRLGGKNGAPFAVALAAKGFVAASTEYRLTQEAPFPAAIEDTKCAVRYLRANAAKYDIDPQRIGVAGSSAGAHLAMLIGTAPASAGLEGSGGWDGVSSRVSAVLSWFGPTDFSVGETAFEHGKGPSIIAFLGGTLKERPENYKKASPITWVAKGDPPLLIFHGIEDTTVPFDQSLRMEKAYRRAGLDVELVEVKNSGHSFKPAGEQPISPSYSQITDKSIAFFQQKLGSTPSE